MNQNTDLLKTHIYHFGGGKADGRHDLEPTIGSKGAGLAKMSKLNIPVPAGFTISSGIYYQFRQNNNQLPDYLKKQTIKAIKKVESITGLKFGKTNNPLLISVRSGAQISMPGMMETILNLGLDDITVEGLSSMTNNNRFAYDTYRRYIETYGNKVLGINKSIFQIILKTQKIILNIAEDQRLTANNQKKIIIQYKKAIKNALGNDFSQGILDQLWEAIATVLKSWDSDRATEYKNINNIPNKIGTAINIQSMVFGNKGNNCATGVAFSRDPSTGKNQIFGEYIANAQGEELVSGIQTPLPINNQSKNCYSNDRISLEEIMPEAYRELKNILHKLEYTFKDMQDVEFTIEDKKCWILQTRSGKKTPSAAIKITVDMAKERIISEKEALQNIGYELIEKVLHSTIDTKKPKMLLGRGLPTSPGATFGKIALSSNEAIKMSISNRVILVTSKTNPEDIAGIHSAVGILTSIGGMTSHAAVITRGIGKPCITGANEVIIDNYHRIVKIRNRTLREGDTITIDGSSGEFFLGKVNIIQAKLDINLKKFIDIADRHIKLKVMANAETTKHASIAKIFNANGIGLCRTEHMFFETKRMRLFKKMILSCKSCECSKILKKLLTYQQKDFYQLFKVMRGAPIKIRLLDPPLHEFFSQNHNPRELISYNKDASLNDQNTEYKINDLKEINPMLGHRGCRIAITYPEIYQMQIKAILKAAYQCTKEGIDIIPEIIIPFIINKSEFNIIKRLIKDTADTLEAELKTKFFYKVGSMIELPSAIINAGEIASESDFISFGTNDLTQTCLGISRDDSSKFLKTYIDNNIFIEDPFVSIDRKTVGELLKIAIISSRKANPKIEIGICGEHAGDPKSIEFFNKIKVDYLSCSPFRIPIAKTCASKVGIQ